VRSGRACQNGELTASFTLVTAHCQLPFTHRTGSCRRAVDAGARRL